MSELVPDRGDYLFQHRGAPLMSGSGSASFKCALFWADSQCTCEYPRMLCILLQLQHKYDDIQVKVENLQGNVKKTAVKRPKNGYL